MNKDTMTSCCASCGKSEGDGIQLRTCTACKSVRYCGITCQRNHRPKHKKACKKRAAELRDEILFKQPEGTHLGDCPICCLPLPIDGQNKSAFHPCCGKSICIGCGHTYALREMEANNQPTCPFCRDPLTKTEEEAEKKLMKRAAANDPAALCKLGERHYRIGDYGAAFKYFTKAAELGNATSHYNLFVMYERGEGVETDEKKYTYHLEEAAIAGQPGARHALGLKEGVKGNFERAVKHFIIAVNLGFDESLQTLKEYYKDGFVSKEVFAAALRAHHAAVNATKSPNREVAYAAYEAGMIRMSQR